MRVKISLTVDIDPQAWTDAEGVEGVAAIREDVRRYVENLVSAQLAEVAA